VRVLQSIRSLSRLFGHTHSLFCFSRRSHRAVRPSAANSTHRSCCGGPAPAIRQPGRPPTPPCSDRNPFQRYFACDYTVRYGATVYGTSSFFLGASGCFLTLTCRGLAARGDRFCGFATYSTSGTRLGQQQLLILLRYSDSYKESLYDTAQQHRATTPRGRIESSQRRRDGEKSSVDGGLSLDFAFSSRRSAAAFASRGRRDRDGVCRRAQRGGDDPLSLLLPSVRCRFKKFKNPARAGTR